MRLLFELDSKDYNPNDNSHTRNSARAIILKDGKIAMIHSETDDFYKFPGGGIEKDEDPIQALIRETKEEAGLIVIPDSILEFGYVHIIQKGIQDGIFIQNNYYYICHTEEKNYFAESRQIRSRAGF